MTDAPPPRPTSEAPEDIGFIPQEMTRWLSPAQLVSTGLRVLLSGIFGTYADKREFQEGRAYDDCDFSEKPELWFDYVSDLGDGFNPTYALATLLAGEKLDLAAGAGARTGPDGPSLPTQRGSLLVMGGDQVYPAADIEGYRNRLIGPYRAALAYTASDHPRILALPGNHDWYDGLTAFTRVFCQGSWIGGWQTSQRRSYFAAALPQGWWLWGIDIQFDTYIDEPQLTYFRQVVGPRMKPGDSIILCSAKPNWVTANADAPDAYDTLDYFQRTTVPKDVKVRLNLTGDTHHYARYESTSDGAQMITAGGGGAFLSASHHLPENLLLPPPKSTHTGKRDKLPASFRLATSYPTKNESRRIARGVVTLARKNPSFVGLVSVVYVLYAWTIQSALRQPHQDFSDVMHELSVTDVATGLARSPVAWVITLVLVLGLAGFTKAAAVPAKKWGLGITHAMAHLVAVVGVIRLADVLLHGLRGLPYLLCYLTVVGAVGGLLGSLVMAAYLYVADTFFDCNANELFAAQRIEDRKNFLRLHIGGDGVVTVYPVKVERVPRKWRLRTAGRAEDPWFEAVGDPPRATLIERPIKILPRGALPD